MPKSHVVLDGKPYVLQDESYISKIIPMFRPQMQVSGISHEALDQYLYMVWDTWDKGSSVQSKLGRWGAGMYGVADFVDTTREGRLSLQPKPTLSLDLQSQTVYKQTRSPTVFENDPSVGTVPWDHPEYAAYADNVYATATSVGENPLVGTVTNYLKATMGTNTFDIPDEADVVGIVVEFRRSRRYGRTTVDNRVRIVKYGDIGNTERAKPGSATPGTVPGEGNWPWADRYDPYGDQSDTWGETWSPSDVNSSDFGVAISATLWSHGTGDNIGEIIEEVARIDHIRITVYYTLPPAFDDFQRTPGPSLGSNWVEDEADINGNPQPEAMSIVEIEVQERRYLRFRAYDISTELGWCGVATWATHQPSRYNTSQLTFIDASGAEPYGRIAGGVAVGVVPGSTAMNFTGIVAVIKQYFAESNHVEVRKYVNEPLVRGGGTLLGRDSQVPFGYSGQVLRLEKRNATIVALIDGVPVVTVTDPAPQDGIPGIVVLAEASETYDAHWDNWTGSTDTPAAATGIHLVGAGDYLYAFFETGPVRRLKAGTTDWETVTYDVARYGAVTAVEVGSIMVPFVVGKDPTTGTIQLVAGTDSGAVWYAPGGKTLAPKIIVEGNGVPVRAVSMYRNMVVAARGDTAIALGVEGTSTTSEYTGSRGVVIGSASLGQGTAQFKLRYSAQVPGLIVGFAPFNQVLMAAIQAGHRGSIFAAMTAEMLVDFYGTLGAFLVQSIATWGSSLVYAGYRPGQEAQVYTYPETLADRLPKAVGIPYDVRVMLPTPEYLLVAFNNVQGLWWLDDKGSGPFCQTNSILNPTPDDKQVVRSAVLFDGAIYYSVENAGVFKVELPPIVDPGQPQTGSFVTEGFITSGWFDGGFPELQKELSDVEIRLDSPLLEGQAVEVAARINDETDYSMLGSVEVGETTATFSGQTIARSFRRIDFKITLVGADTDYDGIAETSPVVVALIARYIPVPVQKRIWGFTVRAEHGLTFADGTRETRTPDQIISDLFALKSAGAVSFASMLEPTERRVYVTDVSLKGQLVGQDSTRDRREEGFVAVELVEA